MSGDLQAKAVPEQMRGGARWIAVVVGCTLLFGPTLWVLLSR